MSRRIRLEPHLEVDELERRYRAAKEPHERSWWQILWLLARGADGRGGSPRAPGIRAIGSARSSGATTAGSRRRCAIGRYTHSHRAPPLLSPGAAGRTGGGGTRTGARGRRSGSGGRWRRGCSQKLGRPISVQLGWAYLVRLDGKRRKPRPRHVQADPAAQAAFKKSSGRSSRPSRPPSPRRGGAVGHRRAPHRLEAHPAEGLVL